MIQINKLLTLVMKALIGILPLSFRTYLKRSPRLTAFYSRKLQQAGMFYGFPSAKKLEASYAKNIIQQNNIIGQTKHDSQLKLSLLILVCDLEKDKLNQLLESICGQTNSFQSILFWCKSNDLKHCTELVKQSGINTPTYVTDNLVEYVSDTADVAEQSWFVVYQNEQMHPELVTVLSNELRPEADVIYVDTDVISNVDKRNSPAFYPDWNPDLQLSTGYISSGIWVKHISMLVGESALTLNMIGIAEWLVRNYLSGTYQAIQHIPLVLLHRRENKGLNSAAFSKSVALLVKNKGQISHVSGYSNFCIQWRIPSETLVSLIIPTKNGKKLVKACIESILQKTKYSNYEILLVDNNSDDPECLRYFDELSAHPKIRLLKYPHPFNYSAINNFAVNQAKGEVIGLVNNDIEVISPTWLDYMVGHVMRDDIGCVGAKLLYADERVQHAGVVMGYGGGAGHAHKYFPRYHPGYLNRLAATGNFSAVTAACLLVKKSDYLAVDGLNEADLTIAFNDVDFCLRVLELGRRNLYCAEAELYHHESISRGFEDTLEKQQRFQNELNYLQTKWAGYIAHDPAYNSNLTLRRENFSIKD